MARIYNAECEVDRAGIGSRFSPVTRLHAGPRKIARVLVAGIALPLMLLGCAEEEAAKPPDIAAGKSLAEAQCTGCHGTDGRGAVPGIPHLASQVGPYLNQSLLAYKEGKRVHAALRDMTANLSDADIRNLAGYYAGLPPLGPAAGAKARETVTPFERGKALANACAGCHGEDGNSTSPGVPSLAGQQPLYFVASMRAYLYGRRSNSTMEMLRDLSRVDMESLALFYASQTRVRRAAPAFGDPAAGEPLSAVCGGCHGAHGVSNDAMTPSLAGQDPQYLVSAIKAYRGHERRHESMFADNSDEEIKSLAAFYAVQDGAIAERRSITVQVLIEKCDRCHGPEVDNPTLAVPKISGQDRDYLIKALRAYRDGKRGSSMMHNMSLPYSEAIIEGVASVYANQPAR